MGQDIDRNKNGWIETHLDGTNIDRNKNRWIETAGTRLSCNKISLALVLSQILNANDSLNTSIFDYH